MRIFLLFGLFFVLSCFSTTITSNFDHSYNKKIERLVIITNFDSLHTSLEDVFKIKLKDRLKQVIQVRRYTLGKEKELSLKADTRFQDALKFAEEFNASHILLVNQKSTTYSETLNLFIPVRKIKADTFDASLIDIQLDKRVWRGKIENDGSIEDSYKAEKMVEELVKSLKKYNLLEIDLKDG